MPSTKKKNKGKGQRAKKGGSGSKSERDKAVKAAKNEDDVAVVTRLVDTTNISDGGPSCWICLEEGPDESGNDIVRNCACRGDSAGFVHLSCLIQYAEKKCHDEWALVVSRGRVIDEKFKDCWRRCPICKQYYTNDLAVKMTDEFISFAEKNYPNAPYMYVMALFSKYCALPTWTEADEKERNIVSAKLLGLIEKSNARGKGNPMYNYIEANIYSWKGKLAMESKEFHGAIQHYEKYRDICKSMGDKKLVKEAELFVESARKQTQHNQFSRARNNVFEGENNTTTEIIQLKKDLFAKSVKHFGENHIHSISKGILLAETLREHSHSIEAERLMAKMLVLRRQLLGCEGKSSIGAEQMLYQCRMRKVLSRKGGGYDISPYQLLRYEGDRNEICVLRPFKPQANTFTMESKYLSLLPGTPVVCHSLVKAMHLNGKMGDIRSIDPKTERYRVYFEDQELSPVSVKLDNILVVFNLTDIELDDDIWWK